MGESGSLESGCIPVWTNPPHTVLPLTGNEVRFAVGTPHGASTNSWKLWVRDRDVYLACRDNFREFKLSLHASGIWRLAFTSEAVTGNPEIFGSDQDRVIRRWSPQLDQPAIVAFQLLVPPESLYLAPHHRGTWPTNVVFIEPVWSAGLAVVSVVVVGGTAPLVSDPPRLGGVISVSPVGGGRSVQIVATMENPQPIRRALNVGIEKGKESMKASIPPDGVIVLFGEIPDGNTWIAALPARSMAIDDGT